MKDHLVFFDSECPLCHRAVQYVIGLDKERKFIFAPLNGKTSKNILTGPLKHYAHANSLVLIEDYESTERKFWIRSSATLRMYWLMGHGWKLLGWLCFMPCWLGDFIYKQLANHRHQFKIQMPKHSAHTDRFLP